MFHVVEYRFFYCVFMSSFTFSYSRRLLCCCQCSDPAQEDLSEPMMTDVVVEQPVPKPGSGNVALHTCVGDEHTWERFHVIVPSVGSLVNWALEKAVEEIVAEDLGVEIGSGDCAPRGEGNGNAGGVGEWGDCGEQPPLQLPPRNRDRMRVQNAIPILRSLERDIAALEAFETLELDSPLRQRFRTLFDEVRAVHIKTRVAAPDHG